MTENGFASTPDYAAFCSQIALEEGIFAHTNVGNLEYKEMLKLKNTNPSITSPLNYTHSIRAYI